MLICNVLSPLLQQLIYTALNHFQCLMSELQNLLDLCAGGSSQRLPFFNVII